MDCEYLVVGGGPTGLGAACRLEEQGKDWRLIEAEHHFGGLASTFVDENGFSWDKGGHVHFSHYGTFDRYLDLAIAKDGWLSHVRESWVWIRKRFVPYPFQNNLHRLDPEDCWRCVEGLLDAADRAAAARPGNFGEWMLATFGAGVTDLFLAPYNFKVWAYPPSTMGFEWIGERVAVPNLETVLRPICTGKDESSWGPNHTFRFPLRGGTGAIWEGVGRRLPAERVELGCVAERVDVARRVLHSRDGRSWKYKHLISTMPLNRLIGIASGVVEPQAAGRLVFNTTHVVGVGLDGLPPEHLKTKCWMYFPESHNPYYRVTVFSNYSPNNVAQPGRQWSLMTETSESPAKPVDRAGLVEQTIRALKEDGLIPEGARIASTTSRRLDQGYPVPFLGRDGVVDPMLRAFETQSIFSRGRFGAWKYEVANQDHSFAQGYECVERLVRGGGPELEPTLFTPSLVNSRRNP